MSEEILEKDFAPGWIPDQSSEKDALASAFPESLGSDKIEDFEIDRLDFPINNQGQFPSCVGQAYERMVEYLNRLEGRDVEEDMSARDVYSQCKKIDGSPSLQGTSFRFAFDVGVKAGVVPNKIYPERHDIPYNEYIKTFDDREPAQKFKIKNYVRMLSLDEALRFSKNNKKPVLIGINGNNSGWSWSIIKNNKNIVPQFEPLKGGNWGHALLLVGRKTIDGVVHLIIENSWGENWGDKGRAYLPINYTGIQNGSFYGAYDLPNNWKDINKDHRSKLMWDKEAVIRAYWGILVLLGHKPITKDDIEIHMKAATPEEMSIGFKQYVLGWINQHNEPSVKIEELKKNVTKAIEDTFKK